MARVFTDGAEFGDTLFWSSVTAGVTLSATARSGSYAYQLAYTTSSRSMQKVITAVAEGYYRMGFQHSTMTSNCKILVWQSAGGTELGSIRINGTSHKLEAYNTTTNLAATGSTVLQPDTYYLGEVHIKIADSGDIEVKLEGNPVLEIDYAGDTKPGADTTFGILLVGGSTGSGNLIVDDLAFNDTTGGVDDSWCGDGKVIILSPNADVAGSIGWTGSDADQTNNHDLVDEIPAVSTDYVEGTNSGDLDLYDLAACGLSNVTILRVWPEARAADTVAAGGQIYLPVKTNGTQYDGTAVTLLTTYTKQLLGDVRTTNPQAGGAWTTTQLDALQVGGKVV